MADIVFCLQCQQQANGYCVREGHPLEHRDAFLGDNTALIPVAPTSILDETEAPIDEYVGQADDAPQDGETEESAEEKPETELFPVPDDDRFDEINSEFLADPALDRLGAEIINEFMDDFGFIFNFNFGVSFLWKRKGGGSGGKATLGKCLKPAAIVRHYMKLSEDESSFVIWIAADHCRERFVRRQMRALMFHELKHIGIDDKNRPVMRKHDFEGFAREIEEFGAWKGDIKFIADAVHESEKRAGL